MSTPHSLSSTATTRSGIVLYTYIHYVHRQQECIQNLVDLCIYLSTVQQNQGLHTKSGALIYTYTRCTVQCVPGIYKTRYSQLYTLCTVQNDQSVYKIRYSQFYIHLVYNTICTSGTQSQVRSINIHCNKHQRYAHKKEYIHLYRYKMYLKTLTRGILKIRYTYL